MSKPITLFDDAEIATDALCALYRQTGWARTREPETVAAMLRAPGLHVSAWRRGDLIGFARALSDGVFRAFIEDVVVDEAARGQGVGRALVGRLTARLADVEEVRLHCRAPLDAFYAEFGFAPCALIHMERRRQ